MSQTIDSRLTRAPAFNVCAGHPPGPEGAPVLPVGGVRCPACCLCRLVGVLASEFACPCWLHIIPPAFRPVAMTSSFQSRLPVEEDPLRRGRTARSQCSSQLPHASSTPAPPYLAVLMPFRSESSSVVSLSGKPARSTCSHAHDQLSVVSWRGGGDSRRGE